MEWSYVLPFLPCVPLWIYIIWTLIEIYRTPTTVEELKEHYWKEFLKSERKRRKQSFGGEIRMMYYIKYYLKLLMHILWHTEAPKKEHLRHLKRKRG